MKASFQLDVPDNATVSLKVTMTVRQMRSLAEVLSAGLAKQYHGDANAFWGIIHEAAETTAKAYSVEHKGGNP